MSASTNTSAPAQAPFTTRPKGGTPTSNGEASAMSAPDASSEISEPHGGASEMSAPVVPSGTSESNGYASDKSASTVPDGAPESSGYASAFSAPSSKPQPASGRRIFRMVACSTDEEMHTMAGSVTIPVDDGKEAEGEGQTRTCTPRAEVVRVKAQVSRMPSTGPHQKQVKVRAIFGPVREHSVAVNSVRSLE